MVVSPDDARLKSASFRGIPFAYLDYSTEGGRRTVTHEYPWRDDNYVEDMGLMTDQFRVNAFLVGDEHDIRADALEAAIRTKGAGELVHPRHGTLLVQITTYTRGESVQSGGMTTFALNFIKAGEPRYPTTQRNVQAAALALQSSLSQRLRAEALKQAVIIRATSGAIFDESIMKLQEQVP